ncbi:MAG: hypothetical protein ACXVB9_00560 [Bdellovibrionota bacterium]
MSILLEILIEFFCQLVIEFILTFVLRPFFRLLGIDRVFKPLGQAFTYFCMAFVISLISIGIHPQHIIEDELLRKINLLFMPLAVGFVLELRGRNLDPMDKPRLGIERFAYAWWFALVFTATRYLFGK